MTGWNTPKKYGRIAVILLASTAIAGCESTPLGKAISNVMKGPDKAPNPPEPPKDENGIIAYDNFRVMVAEDGDTIASLAERVSLSEVVLARYNGLPANYLLRKGDRLALPDEAQVAAVEQGWTPEVVTGVLDELPDAPTGTSNIPEPPGALPLRHRVEPGETLFSIAKLYGVSVTALASWNGIGGDLKVSNGRSLIIPSNPSVTPTVVETPVEVVEEQSAPEAPAATSEPGEGTSVIAPPSATRPLPDNPEVAVVPEGPDLGSQVTPAVAGEKMATPVVGKIIRGFSSAPGLARNDGIDYQTAAGAEVKAAAAGEVALVSPSKGLGHIVLIRHRDNIISVYGRLSSDTPIKKGEKVRKGQVIGTVADANPPTFHFEVRRGTTAIDPTPFL